MIQCLHGEMQAFINKLASKYVKREIIRKLKDDILSFVKSDISLENQKDDKDMIIGNITKYNLE